MITMTRRRMLQAMGAGLGGLALGRTAWGAENIGGGKPPNIVFILADDLGYGDLGCYGQQKVKTPNIDTFAAEGTRFTQCYAGSTVCAPSRCCLMTGYHTGHARVRGNALVPLLPEDVTVAEVLKGAGYHTALIGKWGLGEPDTTGIPNRQGFDYFFGYLNQAHAHNYYPDHLWRNEEKVPLEGNVLGEKKGVSKQCGQYSHDLFTDEALSFLDRAGEAPFFLYLAYTIPHANNERGAAEGDGMEVPDYGSYGEQPWPDPERGRAAMIERLDRDVGRFMRKLNDLGLDENTLVFFTSDNGPHREGGVNPDFFDSSGPLRGIKRDLYEGGIRVPGIARWPGRVPAGLVSDQVWAFWDFLPTAADLAGAKAPEGIDGVSIVPALIDGKSIEHPPLYWEFHEGGYKRAVRMGNWKGVKVKPDLPLELYDMTSDIGEDRDVAADQPDIVEQTEVFMEGARTFSEEWPGEQKDAPKAKGKKGKAK